MKKITIYILISVLVLVLIPINVFAASNPTVSVEAKTAQPGASIDFDIVLTNNFGLNDLSIEITFDSSVYTYESISNVTSMNDKATKTGSFNGNNKIVLTWVSTNLMTYNGVLATIRLHASEDANGVNPIEISYFKGKNGNYIDGVNVNYVSPNESINLQYINGGAYIDDSINSNDLCLYYATYDANEKMKSIDSVGLLYLFNEPDNGKIFCLSNQGLKPFCAVNSSK